MPGAGRVARHRSLFGVDYGRARRRCGARADIAVTAMRLAGLAASTTPTCSASTRATARGGRYRRPAVYRQTVIRAPRLGWRPLDDGRCRPGGALAAAARVRGRPAAHRRSTTRCRCSGAPTSGSASPSRRGSSCSSPRSRPRLGRGATRTTRSRASQSCTDMTPRRSPGTPPTATGSATRSPTGSGTDDDPSRGDPPHAGTARRGPAGAADGVAPARQGAPGQGAARRAARPFEPSSTGARPRAACGPRRGPRSALRRAGHGAPRRTRADDGRGAVVRARERARRRPRRLLPRPARARRRRPRRGARAPGRAVAGGHGDALIVLGRVERDRGNTDAARSTSRARSSSATTTPSSASGSSSARPATSRGARALPAGVGRRRGARRLQPRAAGRARGQPRRGSALARAAAEAGNVKAMGWAGDIAERAGDHEAALRWWRLSAEQGDAGSAGQLGDAALRASDYAAARTW